MFVLSLILLAILKKKSVPLQKNKHYNNYGSSSKKQHAKCSKKNKTRIRVPRAQKIIESRTMDARQSGWNTHSARPQSSKQINAMRYLIDTNVLIDIVEQSGDGLSCNAQAVIADYENLIYISSESVKEFIHLMQEGRIALKKHLRSLEVFDLIENSLGFNVKYVSREHLRTFAGLAPVEGHRDTNDRLIIAQAITEKMPLISSDSKFSKYRKMGLDFIPNR